jgi:predicted phosphodiesterase
MRFAAIADVHGNGDALTAVLADIKRMGIETVVNLGDHVGGPLQAARTADMLIERAFPSVRGNHDRMVVEMAKSDLGLSDKAALAQLKPHHLNWLQALPSTLVFRDEILLCHGTPASDDTYWLERVMADGVVRKASHDEIEAEMTGLDYSLILCGHTHIPRAVRLKDGRMIVNPGSVGLPAYDHDAPVNHLMQTGVPDASYAIVEKLGPSWTVTFRLVPYDTSGVAELARAAGRTEWERALRTGWVS